MTPRGLTGTGSSDEAARAIDFSLGDLGVPSFSIIVIGRGAGATAIRPVSRSDGPFISRSELDDDDGAASAGVAAVDAPSPVGSAVAGGEAAPGSGARCWPDAGPDSAITSPAGSASALQTLPQNRIAKPPKLP